MPAHTHIMNESGNHTHGLNSNNKLLPSNASGQRLDDDSGGTHSINTWGQGTEPLNKFGTTSAGKHIHSILNTGGNDHHNNMPQFYVLAYIIKL